MEKIVSCENLGHYFHFWKPSTRHSFYHLLIQAFLLKMALNEAARPSYINVKCLHLNPGVGRFKEKLQFCLKKNQFPLAHVCILVIVISSWFIPSCFSDHGKCLPKAVAEHCR
uniref:Uncharacterized protein n=1 Tax=Pyxicephalus adspersus TaxID=30357 RepID=A0AAV3AYP1_PYXAD|nr:TPA: hypothetical protein GDO54_009629 [Pyxicephalus adspersus]